MRMRDLLSSTAGQVLTRRVDNFLRIDPPIAARAIRIMVPPHSSRMCLATPHTHASPPPQMCRSTPHECNPTRSHVCMAASRAVWGRRRHAQSLSNWPNPPDSEP